MSKDVKVSFDPSARQMDQEAGKTHLADGHRLAGQRIAPGSRQIRIHGKETKEFHPAAPLHKRADGPN
jgi:hypothetical protein